MLVLSATYMSSLSELVDYNVLDRLLKRTISFLRQSKHTSPSLQTDALILEIVYKKIFSKRPFDEPTTPVTGAYPFDVSCIAMLRDDFK